MSAIVVSIDKLSKNVTQMTSSVAHMQSLLVCLTKYQLHN